MTQFAQENIPSLDHLSWYDRLFNFILCLGSSEHRIDLALITMIQETMKERNVPMSTYTYNCLLEVYTKSEKFETVCALFEELQLDEHLVPNALSYDWTIRSLISLNGEGNLDKASSLFQQCCNEHCIRPAQKTFTTLFSCIGQHNPDQGLAMLRSAHKVKMELSKKATTENWNLVLNAYTKQDRPYKDFDAAFLTMITEHKTQTNTTTFNLAMTALSKDNAYTRVVEVFHFIAHIGLTPDKISYNLHCVALMKLKKNAEVLATLTKMDELEMAPPDCTKHWLQQRYPSMPNDSSTTSHNLHLVFLMMSQGYDQIPEVITNMDQKRVSQNHVTQYWLEKFDLVRHGSTDVGKQDS